MTATNNIPEQPDGINDDSRTLPVPARAAERVRAYVEASGDGLYDVQGGVPLYGRDLESLIRAVPGHPGDVEAGRARTIAEMTADVRAVNTEKGWRAGDNTFGDYIALLHSELSEALEAYRDHRLEDATGKARVALDPVRVQGQPVKPEGVGSEFADVLIRLLDTADVYGIDLESEFNRKLAYNRTRPYQHGGRTLDKAVNSRLVEVQA